MPVLTVYADDPTEVNIDDRDKDSTEEPSTTTTKSDYTKEQFMKDLGINDSQMSFFEMCLQILISDGYEAGAIAGIMGGCFGECSWIVSQKSEGETYGGEGIFGFTTDSEKKGLSEYTRATCTCGYADVNGTLLCSTGKHQLMFMLENIKGKKFTEGDLYYYFSNYWIEFLPSGETSDGTTIKGSEKGEFKGAEKKVSIPVATEEVSSFAEFQKMKNPLYAAVIFNFLYTRSEALDPIVYTGNIIKYAKENNVDYQAAFDKVYGNYFISGDNATYHVKTYDHVLDYVPQAYRTNYTYTKGGKTKYGDGSERAMRDIIARFFGASDSGVPSGNKLKGAYYVYKYLGGNPDSLNQALNRAKDNPDAVNGSKDIAQQLYSKGYWSETDLQAYCKLNEIDINEEFLTKASRNNLSGDELSALTGWEAQMNKMEEDNGFLKTIRISLMILGIIMSVYFILLYLSYWVDRINNFIDLEFLKVLTFNKLSMSETEEECTYSIKSAFKSGTKTVNHRAMIKITVIGELFAVLLITGLVYKFVLWIVMLVSQLLDGVGK